jgi:hypothetical protein
MQDWQLRIKDEHQELCNKIAKLAAFTATEAYQALAERDAELLEMQYDVMCEYRYILEKRIERFT